MATTRPEQAEPLAEDALKKRLLNRIAIAAVMVVGLLGSLAVFDALQGPGRNAPSKVATLPNAVEPDATPATPADPATAANPVTPATPATPDFPSAPSGETPPAASPTPTPGTPGLPALPSPTKIAEPAATPAPTAPAVAAAPTVPMVPGRKPEVKAVPEGTVSPGSPPLQPLPPGLAVTKPATAQRATIRPSQPLPPLTSPAARPDPARDIARSQVTPIAPNAPQAMAPGVGPGVPPRAPASRPITHSTTPHPPVGPSSLVAGATPTADRFFALQMGVFSNVTNAEDLRAKLELNGIPSTIEARVHVGPFNTRAEADAAREKLKELGLDGGLLITMKR